MTQVAFQLPDEDLQAIDEMVPGLFASRAEALRAAVKLWLAAIEEQRIDAALARGYEVVQPGHDEEEWAEISRQSLAQSQLEW
ncbi:MAG TPA: ribbon-helix-helix domain-containing protein [Acidimicrobiia bacterium]|nr:ribbon-helix-helix domain-containing protein [Acidimicrobiia bacterium]